MNRGTLSGNMAEIEFVKYFNLEKKNNKFQEYLNNFDYDDIDNIFMVRVTTKQYSKLSNQNVMTRADTYLIESNDLKLNNEKANISQTKNDIAYRKQQRKMIYYSVFVFLLCIFTFALGLTFGAFSESKSAIGSIKFEIESPIMEFDNQMNFYYADGLTFGNSEAKGVEVPNYMLTLAPDSMLSAYNVMFVLQLKDYTTQSVISSGVTFDMTTSLAFSNGVSMTTPTYNADYSGYVSTSASAVATGSSIDIMEYFKRLDLSSLENEKLSATLTIVGDNSSTFDSSNRTQVSYNATIGVQQFTVEFTGFDATDSTSGLSVSKNWDDPSNAHIKFIDINIGSPSVSVSKSCKVSITYYFEETISYDEATMQATVDGNDFTYKLCNYGNDYTKLEIICEATAVNELNIVNILGGFKITGMNLLYLDIRAPSYTGSPQLGCYGSETLSNSYIEVCINDNSNCTATINCSTTYDYYEGGAK